MFSSLEAKLIVGAVGFALIAGLGACGMRKWDAAEIARLEAKLAERDSLIRLQNGKVLAWKAEGDRMAQRVTAAEARLPAVEVRTVERIKEVERTVPVPVTVGVPVPCPEVLTWSRAQFDTFCQRWRSSPP
jgi:uncharacterized coiled-coil protein SlyX